MEVPKYHFLRDLNDGYIQKLTGNLLDMDGLNYEEVKVEAFLRMLSFHQLDALADLTCRNLRRWHLLIEAVYKEQAKRRAPQLFYSTNKEERQNSI
jgi:hypothetical protein